MSLIAHVFVHHEFRLSLSLSHSANKFELGSHVSDLYFHNRLDITSYSKTDLSACVPTLQKYLSYYLISLTDEPFCTELRMDNP